jgi:hypothetical protein
MLRSLFVAGIIITGIIYAFQGPFYLLLFYLWDAYFRPELWLWTDFVSPLKLSFTIGVLLVFTSLTALSRFRFSLINFLTLLFLAQSLISTLTSEHFDVSMSYWTASPRIHAAAFCRRQRSGSWCSGDRRGGFARCWLLPRWRS